MPIRPISQVAAIPIRDGRVCLITSRSGRRWVVPKGGIAPHSTPERAALAEAWEEAGLLGHIDAEPIGAYSYDKFGLSHHVTVYVMAVTEQRHEWPERTARQREWVSAAEALERIEEPGLRALVRGVVRKAAELIGHS